MNDVLAALRGVADQLNPLSTPNLIIFFTWLVVYLFTAMAIWRSNRRWVRLFCFVINQLFSVGFLISVKDVVVPAVALWVESLIVAVGTIVLTGWLFRTRKPVPARAGGGAAVTQMELEHLPADDGPAEARRLETVFDPVDEQVPPRKPGGDGGQGAL
ncbi:MAG: hypothetical protein ABFS30_08520 [Pseudomonadota bacterium]